MTRESDPPAVDPVELLERLREGKRVRRKLGPDERLNVDRPIPFLCVHRHPPDDDDSGTAGLVTAAASYLVVDGRRAAHKRTSALIQVLCEGLAADFGGFLVIEVWARPEDGQDDAVRVIVPSDSNLSETSDELETRLGQIRLPVHRRLAVEVRSVRKLAPPGLPPLLGPGESGCHWLGIEVPRVYVDGDSGDLFPAIHQALRRGFARAINRAVYRFTRAHTTHRPAHYHELGRQSFNKAVWEVDARLADVSNGFDFLLLTTPRNSDEAWAAFRRSRFQKAPRFSYRPRPVDVSLAKRELYAAPLEKIEDPTISELFREQQDEIDRKLTMIADRGTPRFVQESIQLFGAVKQDLLQCALDILEQIPARARERGRGGSVDARALAARAEEEIKELRAQHDGVASKVEIRSDISGLLVSRGNLLVGAQTNVPAARVEALVQHEVGTHILTYCNALEQPFRQLRVGLPGYEELQEGLAVLAEYLVGGLSRPRLRLLAARVVAVHRMLGGATFVDVFRELDRHWDLDRRTAFTATMRVFRGGGHTKDALYLRGLLGLLEHLRAGRPLEDLYVGKIGLHHLPFVKELTIRGVLSSPPLRPRYLDAPEGKKRMARLREGVAVHELCQNSRTRRRRSSP